MWWGCCPQYQSLIHGYCGVTLDPVTPEFLGGRYSDSQQRQWSGPRWGPRGGPREGPRNATYARRLAGPWGSRCRPPGRFARRDPPARTPWRTRRWRGRCTCSRTPCASRSPGQRAGRRSALQAKRTSVLPKSKVNYRWKSTTTKKKKGRKKPRKVVNFRQNYLL